MNRKRIVIVEGPSGAGKSHYIDEMRRGPMKVAKIDSSFQGVVKSRFTFDELAHDKAVENDVLKMTKACEVLFAQDSCYEEVMIDRWFLSDWAYENIRNFGRSAPEQISIKQIPDLLEQLQVYVDGQVRLRGIREPYDLELVLVCPRSYYVLADRRKNSNKDYPCDRVDWLVYRKILLYITHELVRICHGCETTHVTNSGLIVTLIED